VAQRSVAGVVGQPVVYEPIGYQSLGYRVKKAMLGRPLPTSRLVHERLRKLVALAVFSSDAISSTAYGTVGLPRFDGQGGCVGQATCLMGSARVVVSNSSGVM
jgi:hypothetical protein